MACMQSDRHQRRRWMLRDDCAGPGRHTAIEPPCLIIDAARLGIAVPLRDAPVSDRGRRGRGTIETVLGGRRSGGGRPARHRCTVARLGSVKSTTGRDFAGGSNNLRTAAKRNSGEALGPWRVSDRRCVRCPEVSGLSPRLLPTRYRQPRRVQPCRVRCGPGGAQVRSQEGPDYQRVARA